MTTLSHSRDVQTPPGTVACGAGGDSLLPTGRLKLSGVAAACSLVITVCLWLTALPATACSIPVFRYALDRWAADNYRLEISEADAKDESIAKFIRNFGAASALNLDVVRVPEGPSRLLRPHGEESGAAPIWSGRLDLATLDRLTNSPARLQIVRRLLTGDSGGWVLVESGDRAVDDAAASRLEKRLRYLEQVAQMPPIDPSDPSSRLGPGPRLGVKFSLVRIRHDDQEESAFLTMLAGPRSGLSTSREPWVAVVFGRGRALGAWPAKGFGDEQVEEVCLFLLGACSCQVKSLNPGWDLLLRIDWDEELRAIGYPAEEATTLKGPNQQPAEPETVTISGGESAIGRTSSLSRSQASLLGAFALMLMAAGGVAWRQFVR